MTKKLDKNNDYFLANWIAGKMTDAELLQEVGSEAFTDYEHLRQSLDGLQIAGPDLEKNYDAVKQKKIVALDQKKLRNLSWYWIAAVAALLVFFVGIYQAFVFSNETATASAQKAQVILPDHSAVTLDAQSRMSYPSWFAMNRTVKLEGQAYFEVKKGSTFSVQTEQGEVKVLGTHFSVTNRDRYFEVICYEGRVKVSRRSQSKVIIAGEAVRFYRDQFERFVPTNLKKPEWLQNTSVFKNAPLEYVFLQLGFEYGKTVSYPKVLKQVRFSGSFTHDNLQTALQSICIPLQRQYEINDNGIIVISE